MITGFQSKQHSFYFVTTIILLVPILFYETMLSMIDVWIVNETFTHGFLIFPISLWLLWKKQEHLSAIEAEVEPRLIILILPLLLLWFISYVVDIQVIQQLCMISLIPAFTWLILGKKVVFSILFPLLFLFFSVPLGQGLIPPMMEFTANFVVYFINVFGIPIFRDGLYFVLPSGTWNVVEECSGVRYLIASVALGTIYAYINYQSNLKRLVFVGFAIFIPILANWLRAFGIVMIGHFSGMELATGVDHLVYGWVFFGLVIFLMFYVGSFWWDPPESVNPILENPPTNTKISNNLRIKRFALASIVSILLLKIYAHQITHKQVTVPENFHLSLSDNLKGWKLDKNRLIDWEPEISSPDAKLHSTYLSGDEVVQIDIGYYLHQRQGAEAVTSLNRLTDPYNGQWKLTASSELSHNEKPVREVEIRKSGSRILVWQWYRMGGYSTSSPYIAKIYEAYNQIVTGNTFGAYITISTTFDEDKETTRQRLRNFLMAASREIDDNIDTAKP